MGGVKEEKSSWFGGLFFVEYLLFVCLFVFLLGLLFGLVWELLFCFALFLALLKGRLVIFSQDYWTNSSLVSWNWRIDVNEMNSSYSLTTKPLVCFAIELHSFLSIYCKSCWGLVFLTHKRYFWDSVVSICNVVFLVCLFYFVHLLWTALVILGFWPMFYDWTAPLFSRTLRILIEPTSCSNDSPLHFLNSNKAPQAALTKNTSNIDRNQNQEKITQTVNPL